MNKTIYIDFDGTLVDVFPRYYGILKSYLEKENVNTDLFILTSYIAQKKTVQKDHIIVKNLCDDYDLNIVEYLTFKRDNLEAKKWLIKDKLIGNPVDLFKRLKKSGYRIILLSQRNKEECLISQLHLLDIFELFDAIKVVQPKLKGNAKYEYLKEKYNSNDIIIGDSPIDIECAEKLGITGYFVKTGLFEKVNIKTDKIKITTDYQEALEDILFI